MHICSSVYILLENDESQDGRDEESQELIDMTTYGIWYVNSKTIKI